MKDKKNGAARETVLYLVCGAVSMIVSWAAMFAVNAAFFSGTAHPDAAQNTVLSAANWISGMSAAYVMNRKIVFLSDKPVGREFAAFAVSRLWTLAVDQGGRQLLSLAGLDVYVVTLAMSVIVTVLNYATGKLLVFRARK